MIKKILMSLAFFAGLSPLSAQATNKNIKELENTLSAFSKVINDSSKLENRNEKDINLTPGADKTYQTMNNELEKCKEEKLIEPREIVIQKDGVESRFKVFSIKIYGPECPFNILAQLDIDEQKESSFKGIVKLKIDILDPKLQEKYKISSTNIDGIFNGEITKVDSVVKILIVMDLISSGKSPQLGSFNQNVKFNALSTIDMANFAFTFDIHQFGEMVLNQQKKVGKGHISVIGFGNPTEKYEIDGKEATSSEFAAFMESFISVGSIEEEDPNNPDGKTPTSCEAVVYKKSAMSEDALKKILTAPQQKPTEGLLYSKASCKNLVDNGQNKSHAFEFTNNWITFKSTYLGDLENDAIFVLYQDAAPQTRSTADFTVGVICQKIPKCQ